MELGIQDIQLIIPHRYPFLMIDRVLEIEPNVKLIALKNVSVNEHYFEGHFSGEKIMPGVLIMESMAQAACIFFYYSTNKMGKKLTYYLGRVTSRFFEPVYPGNQMHIVVCGVKLMEKTGFLKTEVLVNNRLVASGEIIFSVKESGQA